MVCLNEILPFNKKKLRNNINKNIQEMIKLKLELELEDNIINKIQENIKKTVEEMFSDDNFIYLNLDDNHCVHKYKRGKHEGYFCTKKIKTNLNGNSKDYLCARHSKKHIPRKRKITVTVKNQTFLKNSEKLKIKENYIHKNKNRIYKKKIKRNRNIFICNSGLLNFEKILKLL